MITEFFIAKQSGEVEKMLDCELFEVIDMLDCNNPWMTEDCDDPWVDVWYYDMHTKTFRQVKIYGIWHDTSNPLYMKVVDLGDGTLLAEDYGTDH